MGKHKIARTLKIGTAAVQRILATTKPSPSQPKTATVILCLWVENNNKFVRAKKRAREYIERFHLAYYDMKKLSNGAYELTIPCKDEPDLDKTLYDLIIGYCPGSGRASNFRTQRRITLLNV